MQACALLAREKDFDGEQLPEAERTFQTVL
jgi:hypothetical protein